jgi:UDP-glucose 4-epimerase
LSISNGSAPARRWLITGGAGFIGSHLVDLLVSHGEVIVLDDLSTGSLENLRDVDALPNVELVEGSTSDAQLVDELVGRADVVIHLAAAVGVQLIVDRPLESLLRNVHGTEHVLGAAARHGRKALFTSTSEVYGKNSMGALTEDSDHVLGSPFKSRWAYAIAKGFGEALAHGLFQAHGSQLVVARLFNCVGPRQTGQYGMVLPRFVRQALNGEDLTVFGNGTQSRCFAHVADTVQAILMLVDHPEAVGKVFNIGSETEIPIIELARRVIERSGSDSRIQLVPYEDAYGEGFEELGRRKPDTTAVRELTGWLPSRTIDDAIDDVIHYEQTRLSRPGSQAVAT